LYEELLERLSLGRFESAIALIEEWFETWLLSRPRPHPLLESSMQLCQRRRAGESLGEIARRLGVSERTLQHISLEQRGMSMKYYARLLRVSALVPRLASMSLTRLAAEAGYADQAHFSRDFREITGVSPSAFLASDAEYSSLAAAIVR
jgi:AraC-like DNA-binding protein